MRNKIVKITSKLIKIAEELIKLSFSRGIERLEEVIERLESLTPEQWWRESAVWERNKVIIESLGRDKWLNYKNNYDIKELDLQDFTSDDRERIINYLERNLEKELMRHMKVYQRVKELETEILEVVEELAEVRHSPFKHETGEFFKGDIFYSDIHRSVENRFKNEDELVKQIIYEEIVKLLENKGYLVHS